MNIAIVCDSVNIHCAGALVSTWRFATNLAKKGHKIVLITTGDEDTEEIINGVHIIRLESFTIPGNGKFQMRFFIWPPKLRKIFIKEKIQLLHFMIPTPLCFFAVREAKRLHLPIIGHSHSQPENSLMAVHLSNPLSNWLFYKYIIKFYSQANVIVCPTKFAENKLKIHGLKKKKVVISNGVDLKEFKTGEAKKKFYDDLKPRPFSLKRAFIEIDTKDRYFTYYLDHFDLNEIKELMIFLEEKYAIQVIDK